MEQSPSADKGDDSTDTCGIVTILRGVCVCDFKHVMIAPAIHKTVVRSLQIAPSRSFIICKPL